MPEQPQEARSAARDSREVESANDRYAIEHPHGNWHVASAAMPYHAPPRFYDRRLRVRPRGKSAGRRYCGTDVPSGCLTTPNGLTTR